MNSHDEVALLVPRSTPRSSSSRNIRQISHRQSSRSQSSHHHRSSSRSGRKSSEKARSRSRHRGHSSKRKPSLSSSSRHDTSSSKRPSRRSSGLKTSTRRSSLSDRSLVGERHNSDRDRSGSSSSRHSSGLKTSTRRSSLSDRSLVGQRHNSDRDIIRSGSSSVGRRNSANDGSRSNERRRRKIDPLSVSFHAKLGGDSSHRKDSGSQRRHPKRKPPERSNSLDSMLSVGTMGVLSEDDEKSLSSDDEKVPAKKRKEDIKKRSHRKTSDDAIKHSLYGNDKDAKAKAKASMTDRGEPTMMPGVQQVSKSRTISTLYASDADAKAKAKASNGYPSELKKKKSLRGSFGQMRSASVPVIQSNNSAAARSLYDGRDLDGKAKAKAKASRGKSARALITGASNKSLLYGSDADAKAKAKASKSPDGDFWSGDDSSDYDDNTFLSPAEIANARVKARASAAVADNTNAAAGLLYGSNEDAKAKHRSAKGSKKAAPVNDTNGAVEVLYGRNGGAKAKVRSSKGRSTVETTNPGLERVSLPAFLAENVVGENDTIGPVAVPVSERGTDVVNENTTVDPDSDWTSRSDSQPTSTICREGGAPENTGVETRVQTTNDPEAGNLTQRHNDPNRKDGTSRKKCIASFLFPIFLIGGGIAIWIFLFKNNDKTRTTHFDSPNLQDASRAPLISSVAPSSISSSTTYSPTTSPSFNESLLFQPPSKSNCEAIAKNETIAGREEMEDADFGLGLDVVLARESAMTQKLVHELLEAIQEKILPSLAGCNIIRFNEYVEAWRFVIFDAFVSGNVKRDERCNDEDLATQNCHLVSVKLDLFLKGRVRFLDIIYLISSEEVNISNHLGLSDVFSVVKLVEIDNLTPTASPTKMPSDAPSWTPSEMPTRGSTAKPTSLPTATPTSRVSGVPTRTPSFVPTLAPSVVPKTSIPTAIRFVPTLAPSVVPKTSTPTAIPSSAPTDSLSINTPSTSGPIDTPSALPSALPSTFSSVTPTVLFSALPSQKPSNQPSRRPSDVPSPIPSTVPSSPAPSSTPSIKPSVTPSMVPSSSPTMSCILSNTKLEAAVDKWFSVKHVVEDEYGPIEDWCFGTGVTDMSRLFAFTQFNEDISKWDVSSVMNMNSMFKEATAFNQDIGGWDVSSARSVNGMFHSATAFNVNIASWDVSSVIDMKDMFRNATAFNQDIGGWDVSKVTNMGWMFKSAEAFDQDIGGWDVSSVTNMESMFRQANSFNGNIASWKVSAVTRMTTMFHTATAFNQDIGGWDVSKVGYMKEMFRGAIAFNGNIASWKVSSVTNMDGMFRGAIAFNGNIGKWDVSSVTSMQVMFFKAVAFNQHIGEWVVSSVTDMRQMFRSASAFNQDIGGWSVSSVTDLSQMFYKATSFNQNLCAWGERIPNSALVGSMFDEATQCPDTTATPVLNVSPPGPFCYSCSLSPT